MLTKLTIRNFKQFGEVEIPLENGVVFIGPNNSGKTSALQALTLWRAGLRKWAGKSPTLSKKSVLDMSEEELLAEDARVDLGDKARAQREGIGAAIRSDTPPHPRKQRLGVTMNRLELTALPMPALDMLWRKRKTRRGAQLIRINVIVEGENLGRKWKCGLEFDTSGGDSFYCRPLRSDGNNSQHMRVPHLAYATKVAMLPPMSGLALEEPRFDEDKRVNALIGEGRTAEVLRNLCFRIHKAEDEGWEKLTEKIRKLFGASLLPPFTNARGAFVLEYTERGGKTRLDLQFAGRGMQQTLLLLAFLQLNPNTALLLDEPDAHLEILRQRQIYRTLLEAAEERNSQIISASHSEVLLNEAAAADRNAVIAFVGKPHPLVGGRKDEVLKALREVGWDQYYLAEQKGWALYLEGETDLDILRAFAMRLDHPAQDILASPFCKTVQNQPDNARRHFNALREARPGFVGILLVDGDVSEGALNKNTPLEEIRWRRREAENYLCTRRTLLEFAAACAEDDSWAGTKEERRAKMENEIRETERASARLRPGKPAPFSADIKASDEFLNPLFEAMPPPLKLRKADFHKLVPFIPDDEVDPEIREKLDAIHAVAMQAKTPQEDDPDD